MAIPAWVDPTKAAAIPTVRAAAVAAAATAPPGTRQQMLGIDAVLAWLNGEVGAPVTGEPKRNAAVSSERAFLEWRTADDARVASVGFVDGVGDVLAWLSGYGVPAPL